jgi:hypothetical protein
MRNDDNLLPRGGRPLIMRLRQLHLPYSLKAQPLLAPSDYQTILYMFPLLSTATPVTPFSDST